MKRRPRVILVVLSCLLAGAIVNVAVAWGCVILLRPSPPSLPVAGGERLLSDDESLTLLRQSFDVDHFSADDSYGTSQARLGWHSSFVTGSPTPRSNDYYQVEAKTAGWPLKSLRGRATSEGTSGRLYHEAYVIPVWMESVRSGHGAIDFVPIGVYWPGFAINTVFYAVIVWLLFIAPFALRRRRRIKRGRCPKSGYDLRNRASDSSVCPECGAPMR